MRRAYWSGRGNRSLVVIGGHQSGEVQRLMIIREEQHGSEEIAFLSLHQGRSMQRRGIGVFDGSDIEKIGRDTKDQQA